MALRNSVGHRSVPLRVEDEGTPVVSVVQRLSFRGAGVTATLADDGLVEVNIPGASGGQEVTRRTVAAPYVVLPDDRELWVTGTGNVTLPAPANGRQLTIRREEGAGLITLVPSVGSIDGEASLALLVDLEGVDLTGNGSLWGQQ